jgi:hypothetical protein
MVAMLGHIGGGFRTTSLMQAKVESGKRKYTVIAGIMLAIMQMRSGPYIKMTNTKPYYLKDNTDEYSQSTLVVTYFGPPANWQPIHCTTIFV